MAQPLAAIVRQAALELVEGGVYQVHRNDAVVGRDLIGRAALQGGLQFAEHQGRDVGVTVINPRTGVLQVLSIILSHQGHGLGSAMVNYLMPNIVRALSTVVPFFERLGYQCVGEPIQGKSLLTQVMVRARLFEIAGRLQDLDLVCNHGDRPETELASLGKRRYKSPGVS